MKSIYSKSKKLILVIFLGLYYYTIEKFTSFIVTDVVTTTILLSSILLLPFATSKYINISINNNNNDSTYINNNNTTNLTNLFTNIIIENSSKSIDIFKKHKYDKNDNNTIIKIYSNNNRKNRYNTNRYKRNWTIMDNIKNTIEKNNDINIIKNESIQMASKYAFTNDINDKKSNNYYYEEQKPLIIIPSESGSIPITDYTGTIKPFILQKNADDISLSVTNIDDDDDDRNLDRNNNHFYDNSENNNRSKYVVTTSTASPSGISDLSSKEMNEYDDNYRNDDDYDDYDRQKYNDENEIDNDNQQQISSYMETAKNVWDIFTAINAAWSAISEKQQYPIDNQYSRKLNENITESTTTSSSYYEQQNNEKYLDERSKRYTNYTNDKLIKSDIYSTTDVAISEGRYIKGDPLKGYYDFVITEGSYKFWAAFQFATAILIIYSTFAAIYYSKVNPLVGDYDYVDYLGGGRSLSSNNVDADDGDTDFIDIPYSESQPKKSSLSSSNDNSINSKTFLSSIVDTTVGNSGDWIPKMGYTLKFILDAIDKIPQ